MAAQAASTSSATKTELGDAVEHLPAAEKREKTMLENLKKLISGVRRSSSVTKAELLIVKTS